MALVLDGNSHPQLAGISIDASATAGKQSFRESVLFTHRGMSGPAILQISNYWKRGEPVLFDLTPETDVAKLLSDNRTSRRNLGNFLAEFLPQRFADEFAMRELRTSRCIK